MSFMKNAILLLPEGPRDEIYSPAQVAQIKQLVNLTDCSHLVGELEQLRPILAETHIILSGWGMMKLDKAFLNAAPKLEAVLYGAGSVRGFVTDEFWASNILLTCAYAANGIPVSEYTVAALVFGLKGILQSAAATREARTFQRHAGSKGVYDAKIGVIGAGMVGTGVLQRLQNYQVETYCYDPYLTEQRAAELKTKKLDLEEMFRICDAVTVHAPALPATTGMVTGTLLCSMKKGAIFINTARGSIVKEAEMIEVLREGNIFAFIDVTNPEPPETTSPLYDLPNVFLTPHTSGSTGDEIFRQGEYVLDELRRFLNAEPPRYPITQEMMAWMA
jgi:phosphoglycerate dehydrogenase-like enzyme